MKAWVSEQITDCFYKALPDHLDKMQALRAVADPDFDTFDIPFN